MRDRKMCIELDEKQVTLLGASYYLTKYVVTHIENMRCNDRIPTEHTNIFIQAIHEIEEHGMEFEQMGTQFLNQLEIVSKEKYL